MFKYIWYSLSFLSLSLRDIPPGAHCPPALSRTECSVQLLRSYPPGNFFFSPLGRAFSESHVSLSGFLTHFNRDHSSYKMVWQGKAFEMPHAWTWLYSPLTDGMSRSVILGGKSSCLQVLTASPPCLFGSELLLNIRSYSVLDLFPVICFSL